MWLSIWSDSQPAPVPVPTLVPDVAIGNVDMLSQVEVGKPHTITITLRNSESRSVTVTLKAYSSVAGEFFSKTVTIYPHDKAIVTHSPHSETAGIRTITYKLFYKSSEIDSWQGTLEATTPSVTIHKVDMVKTVKVGETHTDTITLENNGSSSVKVTLKAYSSVTGEFFAKTLTIGVDSQTVVTNKFHSETPGIRAITYKLFYNCYTGTSLGKDQYKLIEIDSWQGTLEATT